MYLVIAGSTSARAAATRRPLALAIAPWMRSTPNTVANTSGTSTIAKTFQRTGQLLGDQAGGRLTARFGGGCRVRRDRLGRAGRAGEHGHAVTAARPAAALNVSAAKHERLMKLPALFPPAARRLGAGA